MRHIIIDGYNLIHADDALARLLARQLSLARDQLLARLRAMPAMRNDQVTVVFDGRVNGPSTASRQRSGGVTVLYSRQGERADDVIKLLVSDLCTTQPHATVVVVSSDRDLRYHGLLAGAATSSAHNMLRQVPGHRPPHRRDPSLKDDDEDEARPAQWGRKKGPAHRAPRQRTSPDYRF